MTEGGRAGGWWLPATALLLAAGFLTEVLVPHLEGGMLYVAALFVAVWSRGRGHVLAVTVAGTILGVADRIPLVLEGVFSIHHVVERVSVLGAMWVIAILAHRRARDQSEIEAARTAAQRYLDVAEVIIVALDRQARVTMINRAGCELLGLDEEEILGTLWIDRFIPKEDRPEVWGIFERVIADGEPDTDESPIRTARGEIRRVLWRNTKLRSPDGDVTGTLSSGLDVTELRRAEQELIETRDELREKESLARLGEMAAVVAHEVKNPLAGLRSTLQILEGRAAEDTDRQIIGTMIDRLDGLNRIVEDLLSFARPESLHRERVDLCDVVGRVVGVVAHDREVAVDLCEGVGFETCLVHGDPSQLERAVLNLALNAVQASPEGDGVSITVCAEGDTCEVRVQDDGPGVPDEVRDRLFEPFVTTRSRGTGLGLPVTRRIVEAHGGTVSLHEAPDGAGTLAVIRLPRLGAQPVASPIAQSSVSRSARSTST